jgi:hypothetical protein
MRWVCGGECVAMDLAACSHVVRKTTVTDVERGF